MSNSEQLVENWRNEAGSDNPAGPLFAGGAFAAADIVSVAETPTIGKPCSVCTASARVACC
jgi:hypothetical protein